ncbi:acetyl-CoA carboxylase, carboxyltransferase subunit beta [Aerococcaceae bacterium NML201209]|nr:acetyl-CoA carboxylase, carboxyltransferase subunit beta [Aerococcaceae bacterium NML201209]MCW6663244.1 acetyl-CoA carboxylase, carboxyltransferase subunit beta [Aerococcaceae bacterium NML190073]MCW6665377.1 acetyl-CoA carboxylase, carboxyltransferase subunit beta [Aerococcaceae bacterium NML191219]MCW6675634.1 acetyl-CoA carboxylase, carboxyltransferase subunit beta [Aerococcaceae bacterium NML171108]
MRLFRKNQEIRINPAHAQNYSQKVADLPDDLMQSCPKCRKLFVKMQQLDTRCCAHCGAHLQFPAYDRLQWLCDANSFREMATELVSQDPLQFPNYAQKLAQLQESTGLKDAIIIGSAELNGAPIAVGAMDSRFVMASMGTVVGEKIVRLFEYAIEHRLPVILFIASGGARMQEGILSLMQMAKVSQTIAKHSQAGLFYCAVLTHPTTGGVTASFAMQADIILAEPHAIVGFAGKRVIEQTIKATLPDEFQTAETVLEYGFIDQIVERSRQKEILSQLVNIHKGE